MRTALFGALLAISAISAASPAVAQQRVDIRFEPGRSGTTINGTITGRQYIDYVLRARGGQRMNVRLNVEGSNGDGSAYFNILPAGMNYDGLFIGSRDGRTASVILPRDGAWAVRVYLMGNDKDARKTVGYSIAISIAPASNKPGGGGTAGSGAWYKRLVGASSAGAVDQLRMNGFRQVDTFDSGRNAFGTVWYKRAARQCLQVIVVNRKVDSAVDIRTHPKCR
jgi:hypothetical protein